MDTDKYQSSRLIGLIPIYFRSKDNHKKSFDYKVKQFIDDIGSDNGEPSIANEQRSRYERFYYECNYRTWKYNEIIGYLEIRYYNTFLIAYLYLAKSKRFSPRMKKKDFVLEYQIDSFCIDTKDQLLKNKKVVLHSCIKEFVSNNSRFRNKYFDTEAIENVIEMIDF